MDASPSVKFEVDERKMEGSSSDKVTPASDNECSLFPRLTNTMGRATAVIMGGNELDDGTSSSKGTGRVQQPRASLPVVDVALELSSWAETWSTAVLCTFPTFMVVILRLLPLISNYFRFHNSTL